MSLPILWLIADLFEKRGLRKRFYVKLLCSFFACQGA